MGKGTISMIIGITGTREGMTEHQFEMIKQYLELHYQPGAEFHHGDCVGVDAEAALLAREIGYKIVGHPGPDKDGLRAFVECDESREPQSHFKRNRTIVDACDVLLVVPLQMERQERGGTWYTYDYAVKTDTPFFVIYPQ
jgi:hypothetical protein